MKILSLFDGVSIAQQALKNSGIKVDKYFASEIDKYAISITQKNFPETIQLGSVVGLKIDWQPDLLVGGSPCQNLSIAKKNREGLAGAQSGLFWEYVRILKECKPKFFILENVNSMSAEAKKTISEALGVEAVCINAAKLSAQQRKRLFWVGKLVGDHYKQVEIPQPEDKNIFLKDIIEDGLPEKEKSNTLRTSGMSSGVDDKHNWQEIRLKSYCIPATYYKENVKSLVKRKKTGLTIRVGDIGNGGQGERVYSVDGKSVNLSAHGGGRGAKTGLYLVPVSLTETRTEEAKKIRREMMKKGKDWSPRREKELKPRVDGKVNNLTTAPTKESLIYYGNYVRKLTPLECERLQSLPDLYTASGINEKGEEVQISDTRRYIALGNGFNCAVIEHILKYLK